MIKKFLILFAVVCFLYCSASFGQKMIGDCTITYTLSAEQNTVNANNLKNAYKKFYLSGGKTVTEISFTGFDQKTYYNENADAVYISYNIGNDKYMRKVSVSEWQEQFDKYKGAKIDTLNETKNILGYTCKKSQATLADGTVIHFYYTPELKTVTADNPYEFKNIDGLVLQYEAVIKDNYKITYTASNIDFNPVPSAVFVIPKTGYRLLTGKD